MTMKWKGENGGGLAAGLRPGGGECEFYIPRPRKRRCEQDEKIMSTRGRIPVVNECGDGRIERARNERVPVLKGLVSMNK